MVDRGSKTLTSSFRSPVTLLGTLPPFPGADVTNPRDLYSFISESCRHGNVLSPVTVNPQAGARLPPLQAEAAEMQLRELQKGKPHYGSFPDLLRQRSDQDGDAEHETPVRRSSSLQDLHRLSDLDPGLSDKTLKPILRHKQHARGGKAEKQEKHGVKFGREEVRLIRDDPLPPIEGKNFNPLFPGKPQAAGNHPSQGAPEARSHVGKNGSHDGPELLGLSPVHENHLQVSHNLGHRRQGQDLSPDIFPRCLPVEVRKPATPTYEDYPEAYWELRSPTVQDPSDLKEDMIDRDRYRLQQISSLKLKAVPRELAANKLDSYRKWHQQMVESATPTPRAVTATPSAGAVLVHPLADAATGAVNSTGGSMHTGVNGGVGGAASVAGGASAVNEAADKSGKENGRLQKLTVPVHDLAVAAMFISPSTHPGPKKRNSNSINYANGDESTLLLTEEEMRQREKLKAAAIAAGEHGLGAKGGTSAKPVKPAVVNLGMETADLHSGTPTSDLYTGVRRVAMTTRPAPHDRAQSWKQGSHVSSGPRKQPGSAFIVSSVTGSNCATVGSTYRVPSAPVPGGTTDSGAGKGVSNGIEKNGTGKKILKKFNRLQVFGEKAAVANNNVSCEEVGNSEAVLVSPPDKAPYLPQCRPPTYRLDMRNYPPRNSGSGSREWVVVDGGGDGVEDELGGYPVLASGRRRGVPMIQSPEKSEATSLNFRFRNGEVIVSRQGKRQLAA